MKDSVTPRQLAAVAFVAVLSPLIRRFPRTLAGQTGRTAWLSVLFGLVLCAAAIGLLYALRLKAPRPYGLRDLFTRAAGPLGGRLLTLVYALWMVFCSGFALRAFAERFISTVYSGTSPALFILVMAAACLPAALGSFRALARTAMVFRLVMTAVFMLVFFLSLPSLDLRILLPVTAEDIAPNLLGGAEIVNILALTVFFSFAGSRLERGFRPRDWALWFFILFGCIESMCVGCLSMLGPELTANTAFPFFMLARDITVLGSLESIEAFVIGLWVLSDFMIVSVFWLLSGENLRFVFSLWETGPLPVLASAAAAVAVALMTGRSAADFAFFSDRLIPVSNAVAVAVLLPVCLIALVRSRRQARR